MILFGLAAGGLALVAACMRYGRTVLRWGLYATAATAGLFLWLSVGHFVPAIGYAGYTFPFVVAAWIFRRRLARHIWILAWLLERFPRRKVKEFEQAFKDEVGTDGKPSIPVVTKWKRYEQ